MQINLEFYLRKSFQLALQSTKHGNHPFGALLVGPSENNKAREGEIILEAENSVVTDCDCTAHAEVNLIRKFRSHFSASFLAQSTIFASTEPCPMCAGAIHWSGVGRIVFGLSAKRLYEITDSKENRLLPDSRKIFMASQIEVIGPLLESEAEVVHSDFWNR